MRSRSPAGARFVTASAAHSAPKATKPSVAQISASSRNPRTTSFASEPTRALACSPQATAKRLAPPSLHASIRRTSRARRATRLSTPGCVSPSYSSSQSSSWIQCTSSSGRQTCTPRSQVASGPSTSTQALAPAAGGGHTNPENGPTAPAARNLYAFMRASPHFAVAKRLQQTGRDRGRFARARSERGAELDAPLHLREVSTARRADQEVLLDVRLVFGAERVLEVIAHDLDHVSAGEFGWRRKLHDRRTSAKWRSSSVLSLDRARWSSTRW